MLTLKRGLTAGFFCLSIASCDGDVLVGEFQAVGTGGTIGAGSRGGNGGTQTTGAGGSAECVEVRCEGQLTDCGDCKDNDGDQLVDSRDPDCLGPCHNSESGFLAATVQTAGNCSKDCYFDRDAGSGNDKCYWDHQCDMSMPSESCAYDADTRVGPYADCEEALGSLTQDCVANCLPLVPNGCDCFGCCVIDDRPVWLGSEVNGTPSCTSATLDDPEQCRPCTPVMNCYNECERCEVCVGKPLPPDDCQSGNDGPVQHCPQDSIPCGLVGQDDCPQDHYCITGCCILTIK